jgi:putative transposase
LPLIEKMARKCKRPVGGSWRMDETYIKVKGVWKYLYRAVDKQGKTVDFMLTAKRDMAAAKRFFDKALGAADAPARSRYLQKHPADNDWREFLETHAP